MSAESGGAQNPYAYSGGGLTEEQKRRRARRRRRRERRQGNYKGPNLQDALHKTSNNLNVGGHHKKTDAEKATKAFDSLMRNRNGGKLQRNPTKREKRLARDATKGLNPLAGHKHKHKDYKMFPGLNDAINKERARQNGSKNRSGTGSGGSRGHGGGGKGGGGYKTGSPSVRVRPSKFSDKGSWGTARKMVDEENRSQIRNLLNQARNQREDLQFGLNQSNATFDRSKGDLNYVFNEAKDFIGNRNAAIASRYGQTGDALSNIFGGLQGAIQQTSDRNRDAALGELGRLGIQQTGLGQFDSDANHAALNALQMGAGAQANNAVAANSSAEIGNMLQSMSQASLASAVGRATNTRNDELASSRQDYRGNISKIRDQMNGVYADRGMKVNELQKSLEDAAYQRWAETRQQNFNQALAANQFNLNVDQFNADQVWKKAAQRQAAAEARRRRQHAQRKTQQKHAQHAAPQIANSLMDAMLPWGYGGS